MRIYWIAHRSLFNALWRSEWEGSPKGKGYICIHGDSLCCTVEANTILQSNYTPIKINF